MVATPSAFGSLPSFSGMLGDTTQAMGGTSTTAKTASSSSATQSATPASSTGVVAAAPQTFSQMQAAGQARPPAPTSDTGSTAALPTQTMQALGSQLGTAQAAQGAAPLTPGAVPSVSGQSGLQQATAQALGTTVAPGSQLPASAMPTGLNDPDLVAKMLAANPDQQAIYNTSGSNPYTGQSSPILSQVLGMGYVTNAQGQVFAPGNFSTPLGNISDASFVASLKPTANANTPQDPVSTAPTSLPGATSSALGVNNVPGTTGDELGDTPPIIQSPTLPNQTQTALGGSTDTGGTGAVAPPSGITAGTPTGTGISPNGPPNDTNPTNPSTPAGGGGGVSPSDPTNIGGLNTPPPTTDQATGQAQSALGGLITNPNPYNSTNMQQIQAALTGNLNQQFSAQQKALDEQMAARGIGASSIAGGYYGDLAGQQANAEANLNAQLLQSAAGLQQTGQLAGVSGALGLQNQLGTQGLGAESLSGITPTGGSTVQQQGVTAESNLAQNNLLLQVAQLMGQYSGVTSGLPAAVTTALQQGNLKTDPTTGLLQYWDGVKWAPLPNYNQGAGGPNGGPAGGGQTHDSPNSDT